MKDHYDKAKFTVTKNVFIFMCIAMAFLSIINILNQTVNTFSASIAFVVSCIVLFYLQKTKKYFLPAVIAILSAFILNIYNLFGASNFENYVDLFWILNLSLFAFFTLGKRIGLIFFLVNISFVYAVSIAEKMDLINLRPASKIYDFYAYFDLATNLTICSIFFAYIISQFLTQTQNAEKDAIEINTELQKQFDEKSIMLKEIHHRVKNNLQVVTSLLRLQQHKIDDPKAQKPFQESINRVSAMALIHEQMYQGDKVKGVNIEFYIKELAKSLISNYSYSRKINLKVTSTINTIDLSAIVPLSLILNELISNSLKHAFTKDENNNIEINITSTENMQKMNLVYQDNGIWKDYAKPESFGLELIETFTEQLDGSYTLNTDNGSKYTFEFKL